jgi:hypothetical protein
MAAEDGMWAGMAEEEARRAARLRLGNPVSVKERTMGADAALGLECKISEMRVPRRSRGYSRLFETAGRLAVLR